MGLAQVNNMKKPPKGSASQNLNPFGEPKPESQHKISIVSVFLNFSLTGLEIGRGANKPPSKKSFIIDRPLY
jgi:hypothetical protein